MFEEKLRSIADNAYLRLLSYFTSAVTGPAIVYLLLTVNSQGQDLVSLKAQLPFLTSDRYTAHDASRDQAVFNEKIGAITERLCRLEADHP